MRILFGLLAGLCLLAGATGVRAEDGKVSPSKTVDFQRDIRPLLAENCFRCHGPSKQKGDLRLDSLAAIREGGQSGPSVIPGKSLRSLLVRKSDADDDTPHKGAVFNAKELALVKTWIDQGAWAIGPSAEVTAQAKRKGAEEVPSTGEKGKAEAAPSKGKKKAASAPSKGKKSKGEAAPSKGKKRKGEAATSKGKGKGEAAPSKGKKGKAEAAPSKGKKGKAEAAPSKGKKGKAASAPSKGKKGKGKKANNDNDDDD